MAHMLMYVYITSHHTTLPCITLHYITLQTKNICIYIYIYNSTVRHIRCRSKRCHASALHCIQAAQKVVMTSLCHQA